MLWTRRPREDDEPADVLQRLARGDTSALDIVYRAEAGEVYRYALAMCGNPAWSADAVQDAFVQLAENVSTYDRAKGPLRGWLCGIARHRLLARWRESHGVNAAVDATDADPDDGALGSAPSPEYDFIRAQDTRAVWDAIAALPWMFREAVVLVDLQERPYAEAAQVAGIDINTLRTRLHRARRRLAHALAPQYGVIQ